MKKKVCIFCKDRIDYVDYKDVNLLRKFMSDRGKIRARRVSGNCAQHQRDVAVAIKTSRELALLPYTQRTTSERPGGRGPSRVAAGAGPLRSTATGGRPSASGAGRSAACREQPCQSRHMTPVADGGRAGSRGGRRVKVVLRGDISGVGKRGDIVDVSDGFARNHLVPSGQAIVASDGITTQAASMRRARDFKDACDRESAETVAQRLRADDDLDRRPAPGGRGKLFGSVTSADIVEAVSEQAGVALDRHALLSHDTIKELGRHEIGVRLHPEVEFSLAVEVVAPSPGVTYTRSTYLITWDGTGQRCGDIPTGRARFIPELSAERVRGISRGCCPRDPHRLIDHADE